MNSTYITCAHCERSIAVNPSGLVRKHQNRATGRACAGSGRPEAGFQRAPGHQEEAPLLCTSCPHTLGELRKPCGVTGCQCWCNR